MPLTKDIRTVAHFLRWIRPSWRIGLYAGMATVFALLIQLPLPLGSMYVIDDALPSGNIGLLNIICIALLVAYLIKTIASFVRAYLLSVFREKATNIILPAMFRHVAELPISFFQARHTTDILVRSWNDVSTAQEGLMGTVVIDFAINFTILAFGTVIIFFMHWQLATLSILLLPLFAFSGAYFGRRIREAYLTIQKNAQLQATEFYETFSGIYEIKSFTAIEHRASIFEKIVKKSSRDLVKAHTLSTLNATLSSFLTEIAGLIVLWYGGAQIIEGSLTLGKLVAFNAFLGYFYGPIQALMQAYGSVQQGVVAAGRLFELIDLPTESSGGKHYTINTPQIRFSNVSFSYDGKVEVLHNITLEVEAGMRMALVGESGAGKSTLVALLLRLFEPSSGSILIDGRDIRQFSVESLRRQIGVVPQTPFLFYGSIKDNIRFGRPDSSDGEIEKAARLSNAHDYIVDLPDGYDTHVGQMGVKLSGGQRQRIAIARTILKDPKILVLDEATSSIEASSENLINEALSRLMRGRTTIVIAHRLSTVLLSDKICVLHHGRVVGFGRHEELYETNDIYHKLYEGQLQREKQELTIG